MYHPKPGTPVSALDTPALLLDFEAFQRNVQRMAAYFADRPMSLRPHVKTHKCPRVARYQLSAGAIGLTCAKVSEAEVMAAAGVDDLLIANQVTGETKIDRLTDLARSCSVMVAVDDAGNVAQLSGSCVEKGVEIRVLVEVDIGMKRCGVAPGAPAVALSEKVAQAPGLAFKGLMGYEGHLVLVGDEVRRTQQVRSALEPLQRTVDQLEAAGLAPEIVSGGGTGTFDITGAGPPMTEIQAGSYVFMDSTYCNVRSEFEGALSVLSSVVSRPTPERVVVDAGMKAMTTEFGWPKPLHCPELSVTYLSEEHGVLSVEDQGEASWNPGDRILFQPSHCCTTVNLHDELHVVADGKLMAVWPITARGCVQ